MFDVSLGSRERARPLTLSLNLHATLGIWGEDGGEMWEGGFREGSETPLLPQAW